MLSVCSQGDDGINAVLKKRAAFRPRLLSIAVRPYQFIFTFKPTFLEYSKYFNYSYTLLNILEVK